MTIKHYKDKRERRHLRLRRKIEGTAGRPRLSVFRSNKHIYAQVVDDARGETLVAASDLETQERETTSKRSKKSAASTLGTKIEVAHEVGKLVAKKALKKGMKTVVFDRGGYKYHGRVEALAEGAREGGLEF